jgi:light-harvesting complex 1 beta chain
MQRVPTTGKGALFFTTRTEVTKMNSGNISGLTNEQAKEFHEHWKHGVWSWVMIASAVHLVTWAYQPWF